MHDEDFERSYRVMPRRGPLYWITLPLAALLVVVTIISALVFGGVIQGHAGRAGPEGTPTTQSTVIITPQP